MAFLKRLGAAKAPESLEATGKAKANCSRSSLTHARHGDHSQTLVVAVVVEVEVA